MNHGGGFFNDMFSPFFMKAKIDCINRKQYTAFLRIRNSNGCELSNYHYLDMQVHYIIVKENF